LDLVWIYVRHNGFAKQSGQTFQIFVNFFFDLYRLEKKLTKIV
jgi:hypothetical protein